LQRGIDGLEAGEESVLCVWRRLRLQKPLYSKRHARWRAKKTVGFLLHEAGKCGCLVPSRNLVRLFGDQRDRLRWD
jgi:hypothetical protein